MKTRSKPRLCARVAREAIAASRPQVEPCHTDDGHFYRLNAHGGILVPSVTSRNVMKGSPHLMKWAASLCFEKALSLLPLHGDVAAEHIETVRATAVMAHVDSRDDSGDVGTQAHALLETYVNAWMQDGRRPEQLVIPKDTDPRAIAAMRGGIAYLASRPEIEPVACEVAVGFRRADLAIAGTVDLVVWNHEKKWLEVLDYKTSNRVEPFYAAQLAAYAWALEKMAGVKVKGPLTVVKLDKGSDRYEAHVVADQKAAERLYVACDVVARALEVPAFNERKTVVTI